MPPPDNLTWKTRSWYDLTKDELYAALKLRAEIFVVEQADPYCDPDDGDQKAVHFLVYDGDALIGYARLFLPGAKHATDAVLGRVCCHKNYRGIGLGQQLLARRLDYIAKHAPGANLRTQLQAYRVPVYEKLGWAAISEPYLDGTVLHVDMIKKA